MLFNELLKVPIQKNEKGGNRFLIISEAKGSQNKYTMSQAVEVGEQLVFLKGGVQFADDEELAGFIEAVKEIKL